MQQIGILYASIEIALTNDLNILYKQQYKGYSLSSLLIP
jgi:hypothetical protein